MWTTARRNGSDEANRSRTMPLDPDHVRMIDVLKSAPGGSMSYADLEERGVRRPASAGYELAAAGWPIVHTVIRGPGESRRLGLRLLGVVAEELAGAAQR